MLLCERSPTRQNAYVHVISIFMLNFKVINNFESCVRFPNLIDYAYILDGISYVHIFV